MSIIQFENRAGAPIQSGKTRIVPISRAMILNIPGFNGGLIWNHPAAVTVQMEEGPEHVLAVQDVTRQAQIAILGAALIGSFFAWLLFRMFSHSQPAESIPEDAERQPTAGE
jgi:hypothetical protein